MIEHGNRMPNQLSLTGFDAAPRWTDRLFFAIFPDVHAAAHLEQLHSLLGRTVHVPLARWPLPN